MIDINAFVDWAFVLLSLVAIGFTLGIAATIRSGPRPSREAARPPVTLLKPLHLAEPELEDNLRTFFRQDYEGPVQIVFGTRSWGDPALEIVERLRRDYPAVEVYVVAGARLGGSNPKVANLINMVAHAKHDVLILSDSDIRVGPDYVRQVTAALDEPEVGAVSCLYSGRPAGNLWSTLAAMGIDYHFLPNARFGIALGLTEPCFGSTIALRRQTLDEVGGFESLSNVLADDYELGRAIREKGYQLSIPASPTVEHVCGQMSAGALLRQELRWAKTNLMLAKSGYAGTLLTYPLPLALLGVLFQGFSGLSLVLTAAALGSRLVLAIRSGGMLGLGAKRLWLLPLRDVLSFGVFVASFFGKTVTWRGTRYLAGPNGALAQL
jgi:ceramide glucosyltransferase